jgi:hypothetical protein
MGLSLEVVLWIARFSAEASPDVDVPRLDGTGMALAAVAIALFCILARKGRLFAILPAAAAITVWLTAPQAIGYVSSDGAVFLEQPEGWVQLTDWRHESGLDPLIVGDDIGKSPSPGKGAACELQLLDGAASIAPSAAAPATGCPSAATLTLSSEAGAPELSVNPYQFANAGGAAIVRDGQQLALQPAIPSTGRAWEQPPYRKRETPKDN